MTLTVRMGTRHFDFNVSSSRVHSFTERAAVLTCCESWLKTCVKMILFWTNNYYNMTIIYSRHTGCIQCKWIRSLLSDSTRFLHTRRTTLSFNYYLMFLWTKLLNTHAVMSTCFTVPLMISSALTARIWWIYLIALTCKIRLALCAMYIQ